MNWKVSLRPEVESDMAEAISWYNDRQTGLGVQFAEEVFNVWDHLAINPRLNSRRHPSKNILWCYPNHFPYRVVYEINEELHELVVLGILHAARHESEWQSRSPE